MPSLSNTLQGHDLFFLQIVANAWGIELNAPDSSSARPVIITGIIQPDVFEDIFLSLPEKAQDALLAIYENEGHIAWARFTREFGEVRVMGASRRDRERPDLKPASPAEILWYRALIGRAFLNFHNEPQEYAYLPEEIIALLEPFAIVHEKAMTRQASPGEISHVTVATDEFLQDACTYLAAFRKGILASATSYLMVPESVDYLSALLTCHQVIMPDGQLNVDTTRKFLETPRERALLSLYQSWIDCTGINELKWVRGLKFDSLPRNNPLQSRTALLEKLFELNADQWWNIDSFINIVFQQNPDFLRPSGDYDAWFIEDTNTGDSLRGFRYWDQVEGRFIRYMICGPFHWLGLLDLAGSDEGKNYKAFRISETGIAMIANQTPHMATPIEKPIEITSKGALVVPLSTALTTRYQIARFCEWKELKNDCFYYQLNASSLINARHQGLKASHLIALLQKVISHPLPGTLRVALENWEKSGQMIEIHAINLLRVENPDILTQLMNSKNGKFLEEILSATAAIIRPGAAENVSKAIYELGYFSHWRMD